MNNPAKISGSLNVEIVDIQPKDANGTMMGKIVLAPEDAKRELLICGIFWPSFVEMSRTEGRQFNIHNAVNTGGGSYVPSVPGFVTLINQKGEYVVKDLPAAYMCAQLTGTPFRFAPSMIDYTKSYISYGTGEAESFARSGGLQLVFFTCHG